MDKIQKYVVWISLLALVSFSNPVKWCRHNLSWNMNAFRFINTTRKNDEKTNNNSFVLPGATQAAKLTWETLSDVTFRKKYNQEYKANYLYPVFGEKVKKLKGRELYITGFIVPLNIKEGLYAVSYNPYSSCYFCGAAGPESVVSLKFKSKPRRYDTDEYLTMKGILELNDTDVNDFIYIFKSTEEYEP